YTEKYIGEKILEVVKTMGIKKQTIGITSGNVVNDLNNSICQSFLQRNISSDLNTHGEARKEMKNKLQEHWTYLSRSSVISTLLEPLTKLETFYETDRKLAINQLKSLYSSYKINNPNIVTRPIDKLKTFRQFMKLSENRRESEMEIDELEAYLSLPHEPGTDPLSWWKVNTQCFLIVSSIAADHLVLKVTNTAFSSIKDTINFSLASSGLEETVKALLLLKSWFEEGVIE
ncbi:9543_t:CDS:2, partial [Gigaspora rosea]